MELFADIPYTLEALFAAFRISLWFILLFGVIGPLFLDHTKKLQGIEKLVYSWVGLGGVIIFSVFVLTTLHIYDFISFMLTLLLIPLIRNIWKSEKGIGEFIHDFEIRTLVYQVKLIERYREGINWRGWKKKKGQTNESSGFKITQTTFVVVVALLGGIMRMYPALINAAPFSRNWYYELNRVKNLRLQDYFSGNPESSGLHSLVSVFSMLTQVSPEMILHLLGALSSFFLCILIYWSIRDITKNEVPMASVFGMSLYALTPLLLMPLSLDLQIEANTLDLALCFAIPTLTIFVRNVRSRYKSPWFYVLSGFIATGMTNFFVAVVILLPLMIAGLLSLPRRRYWRSFFRLFGYLLTMTALILLPILTYNFTTGIDQYGYFLERMLNTQVYTYNPLLIMPIEDLSLMFIILAGVLGGGYLAEFIMASKKTFRDELVFLIIFGVVALLYSPYVDMLSFWVDSDQLDSFYSIQIAIFGGIVFASVLRWGNKLVKLSKNGFRFAGMVLFILLLSGTYYWQGGLQVSRQLPSTIPNGFHESYYNIIGDYLPYSYAIVAPEVERISAKNRHYFMNYDYFLAEYSAIDSLYRQQIRAAEASQIEEMPPASIFIFLEKPPYKSIQQGILYNASGVMRDLQQWLTAYREREGHTLKVYYEDQESLVYQIINRENESKIGGILWNVYSEPKREDGP